MVRVSMDAFVMNNWSWIDHLLPSRCLFCSTNSGDIPNICNDCWGELPRTVLTSCRQCARPLAHSGICGQCLQQRPAFTASIAALRYEGSAATLIQRFKFNADQTAGKLLATTLAQHAAQAEQPDFLVPIPLSRQRIRWRGFDQSWELARWVARGLGLTVNFSSVQRFSDQVPQSSLNTWSARRQNVHGVFHVEPTLIEGAHVALIDDVMTSGATAESLARLLKTAGARRVDVWVACRAGLSSTHSDRPARHG